MPLDKWERKHLIDTAKYEAQIQKLYDKAIREAARLTPALDEPDVDVTIDLKDYPIIKDRVDKLTEELQQGVETSIVNGVDAQWTLANNKNSALADVVFGSAKLALTKEQAKRYYSNNYKALEAFKARKTAGLSLSDRVWRYSQEFKGEIEMGLALGIREGVSAAKMATDLQQYLQHPDKLFRRVRDEFGDLQLSQAAQAFHSGQGVYRSSYMNARRLAATETNIAYRTSDYMRYQQFDFVVGIKIELSNNHNCKGVPQGMFFDICDELQGEYPKDFKFTGWHPHCRCHVVTILKTDEELDRDNERIMNGEEPLEGSKNEVKDVPENFKKWQEGNVERAKTQYTMPYFVRDNKKYISKDLSDAYGVRNPYRTFQEHKDAIRYNKKHNVFTDEQMRNISELNELLPVKQGRIMNFTDADQGRANPDYIKTDARSLGFYDNCQTCTMAYELRRRGFDVEAMPNQLVKGYKNLTEFSKFCRTNQTDWTKRFLNNDGTPIEMKFSRGIEDKAKAKQDYIYSKAKETGRYEVYCQWKGKKAAAHVFIIERDKVGNVIWYDPQSGRKGSAFDDYIEKMKPINISVTRIDDKIINPVFAKRFLIAR